MRKQIIAGNWKMNNSLEEGIKLASEVIDKVNAEKINNVDIIFAPPFTHLTELSKLVENQNSIYVAAQNCNEHDSGAYTGEVSALILKSIPVDYVIIGHSERREYFKESDELLADKVDQALKHGLIPIFCCGEALSIRESGTHEDFVSGQLTNSLFHLDNETFSKLIIAYEPIWAIGTGVTASAEQAQEMHLAIRTHIESKYGKEIAENCSILYGGSCKPSNATELFALEDVDGGLIGGASLKSDDFVGIIQSF